MMSLSRVVFKRAIRTHFTFKKSYFLVSSNVYLALNVYEWTIQMNYSNGSKG